MNTTKCRPSTKLAQSCLVRISGHRGLKWRPIDWSWRSWSVDELSPWIYERSSDACELCFAFKASEFIVALGSYFNDRTLAIQTHRVTFVFFLPPRYRMLIGRIRYPLNHICATRNVSPCWLSDKQSLLCRNQIQLRISNIRCHGNNDGLHNLFGWIRLLCKFQPAELIRSSTPTKCVWLITIHMLDRDTWWHLADNFAYQNNPKLNKYIWEKMVSVYFIIFDVVYVLSDRVRGGGWNYFLHKVGRTTRNESRRHRREGTLNRRSYPMVKNIENDCHLFGPWWRMKIDICLFFFTQDHTDGWLDRIVISPIDLHIYRYFIIVFLFQVNNINKMQNGK